jgi:cell division protein FtsA
MPEQFLIALDIGTSKIGVAVVRRDLHGGFRYVAHGSAPSGGMQAGQFHDLDAVSTALRRGLAEAHSLAGVPVNDVALTVGGIRIDALDLRGSTVFERLRDIQAEDVRRAIERAQHPDATGLHPIQRVVQLTLVDGEPVQEAVGRRGGRLDVSVRDYAISTQTLEQIRTVAGQSGARIHTFIPAGARVRRRSHRHWRILQRPLRAHWRYAGARLRPRRWRAADHR